MDTKIVAYQRFGVTFGKKKFYQFIAEVEKSMGVKLDKQVYSFIIRKPVSKGYVILNEIFTFLLVGICGIHHINQFDYIFQHHTIHKFLWGSDLGV